VSSEVVLNTAEVTFPGDTLYQRVRVDLAFPDDGPTVVFQVLDRRFRNLRTLEGRAFRDGQGGWRFFPPGVLDDNQAVTIRKVRDCGCGGISVTSLADG